MNLLQYIIKCYLIVGAVVIIFHDFFLKSIIVGILWKNPSYYYIALIIYSWNFPFEFELKSSKAVFKRSEGSVD